MTSCTESYCRIHGFYVLARQRTAEKIWNAAQALYYYWPSDLDDDPEKTPWWEVTMAFQATEKASDETFTRMVDAVCSSDHHTLAPCAFRFAGMRMIPASEVNGEAEVPGTSTCDRCGGTGPELCGPCDADQASTAVAIEDAVRRYLAADGSYGVYDALKLHEARRELIAWVGAPDATPPSPFRVRCMSCGTLYVGYCPTCQRSPHA
jgi:hypothetical protein